MSSSTFVDFRAIKASVTMAMALDHYAVNWLRKRGAELRGRCPIHQGEGTDTFHVSLSKNAFQCFSCKARGNVLDFVAAMEQCTIKEAAVKLAQWFSVTAGPAPSPALATSTAGPSATESRGEQELQNKPLAFQLRGIDATHPHLAERGVTKELAQEFGIGYFPGKGSMAGRLVIPIHNEDGELVAYAGRSLDGSEPKYKLPAGFHKSLVVYNLHRAKQSENKTVVIVEGFFDCLKVWQAGFPAVALMGSAMSETQQQLLTDHFSGALLLFDGDAAGAQCTDECLSRLGRRMWVKAIAMPENEQPDQMNADQLLALLR